MSNHLAVATVTAALRKRMENTLSTDLTDLAVTVSHGRPNTNTSQSDPSVNLFLYQVTPNGALSNVDMPTRTSSGRLVMRPMVALNLHYLLSFYGDETQLVPQRIFGSVVRLLEAQPVITRECIETTIADPTFSYLIDSDLPLAEETVKFSPEPMLLEEMSRLWTMFAETPYALSVAYRASVVTIETAETAGQVLPVARRQFLIIPSATGAARLAPNDIPDLQMWLASDIGLTYDSAGVSRWEDQSGNGNHASQTAADHRPRLVANGIASKPVLRFDGDNDYLAIERLNYTGSGEIRGMTICALVKSSSSKPQIIASFDRDEYWRLTLCDDADGNVGWDTADSAGTVDDLRTTEKSVDGRWHLIFAWFDASSVPNKRLFIDGTEVARNTAHAGNSLGHGNVRFGFVGVGSEADRFDGDRDPPWHLDGDMAELLIYHRALSDEQRGELERYFVNRYRQ